MGVLLLLMTIGGSVLALLVFAISLIGKRFRLMKFALGGVAVWFGVYAILLIGTSLVSKEKTLSLNQPKEFCGFYLDCHMHTAVADVRKTKKIGDREARGEFYIVTVRVFSDAGRATLGLHDVAARIVDERGREFERVTEAETKLPGQPPFDQRVAPAGSFRKEIVFDLPADAAEPRLDVREDSLIDRAFESVLIGDEDSFLHKRNYFGLEKREDPAVN